MCQAQALASLMLLDCVFVRRALGPAAIRAHSKVTKGPCLHGFAKVIGFAVIRPVALRPHFISGIVLVSMRANTDTRDSQESPV
jgi:hypothetical protein